MFDQLLQYLPFSLKQREKEALLLAEMTDLTAFHSVQCEPYRRIIDAGWGGLARYERLADLPFLPVSLFKEQEFSSTAGPSIVLQSSGTTGQVPSRIIVDNETAARQAQALVATFRPILGDRRLPFLAIDTKSVITATGLTARGAGVLGMMKFGAKATFALDSDLALQREVVRSFLQANGQKPFLIFGFTFLVWSTLYRDFADGELDLSQAILVHSGGWKKLEAEKVSNAVFRQSMMRRFNLHQIYNFYGFVEQIGSIFLEGPDGLLSPPNFTDVIIRRPGRWDEADVGEEGVIQVVSLLPRSYPGHSVLTEDVGTVVTVDSGRGGRLGKAIRVSGRVPRAELRGCSDVIAAHAA